MADIYGFRDPFPRRNAPREMPVNNDPKERARQLQLGMLWKTRALTNRSLADHGVRITPEDIAAHDEYVQMRDERRFKKIQDASEQERFALNRARSGGMKNTEVGIQAEGIFFEGADADGMTRTGHGEESYRWFGEMVYAYPTHPFDDDMSGADAILMFIDEEEGLTGYPIAVDVTTSEDDHAKKMGIDLAHVGRGEARLSDVYWADTTIVMEKDSDLPLPAAINEPEQGKIKVLNASVFIPASLTQTFFDPRTTFPAAEKIMKRLRPFVLRQLAFELEIEGLMLLGRIRHADVARERYHLEDITTREDLIESLLSIAADTGSSASYAAATLVNTLPRIWEAQADAGAIHPDLEAQLPAVVRRLGELPKRRAFARDAE